jgi:acetyl esterase
MITRAVIDVDVREVLIAGPEGNISARLYESPVSSESTSVLVYFHGGGFLFGDLDGYDDLCRLISRDAAVNVLSIDYRLAPEHKAPAALVDAYAAYRWAVDHAEELGAHSSRVAVGGDSAGANLAAVVSHRAHQDGASTPVLQWLLYPVTELAAHTRSRQQFGAGFLLTTTDMNWLWEQYLDGSDVEITDPQVSPLLADDLSGQPPAFIVTAGFDPLRDEGDAYGAALRAAGVSVDLRCMTSQVHGFANFIGMGGDIDDAVTEIISALRAHLCRL